MIEARTNRRLAAILAADVVGYSRMMGENEAATMSALRRHRSEIFDPEVERHSGRIVKLMGDGTLVEFASVVDAVACALAIQRAVKAEAKVDRKVTLRIGINLGDVVIEGDDIYGDGVNVAARLEPLAEPGGVCIAAIVNESIGSRIDVKFQDGGEVTVKNIDRPIRVWKWHPDSDPVVSRAPMVSGAANGGSGEQPSIAVLPFTNMSGDSEQEYFSDGITEDIITDLSKVGGLMVIARNSSFTYKGRSVDVRQVGRDLGVRSVLEGSIRRAANRVRITAQLIDAGNGGHLWAERYDRDLTDIFEVQDEVTKRIVEALRVALSPHERKLLARGEGTASIEAHDLFLKGRELLLSGQGDAEAFEKARTQFERAVELDPDYGEAWAGLAMYYGFAYNNTWTGEKDELLKRADELAMKALKLAPRSALVQDTLSMTAGFSSDYERSKKAIDAALEIAPNDASALLSRGALLIFTGEPAAAIADLERSIRLDPAGASQVRHFLGMAHLLLGNYETAVAQFRERILANPETDLSRSMLIAALGQLGEIEQAKKIREDLRAVNPDYSLDTHLGRLPFRDPKAAEPIRQGWRKAGLGQ